MAMATHKQAMHSLPSLSFPNNERKKDCGNTKTYLNKLSREFSALLSLIAHIATGKRNISHKYAFQQ